MDYSTESLISKKEVKKNVLSFLVGDEEYSVDVTNVLEIIKIQEIFKIPQVPEFVAGIVNIRGKIITVFDLALKFKIQNVAYNEDSKIIVLKEDNINIGFLVSKVIDCFAIDVNDIEPMLPVKTYVPKDCIVGIGKYEEKPILILDFKTLHSLIVDEIKQHLLKRFRTEARE